MPNRKVAKREDRDTRKIETLLKTLEYNYKQFCESENDLTEEEKEAIKVRTRILLSKMPQL